MKLVPDFLKDYAPRLLAYSSILPVVAVPYLLEVWYRRSKSSDEYGIQKPRSSSVVEENDTTRDVMEDIPHIPYRQLTFTPEEMEKRSWDFYQLMDKRRSVRFFSDKPVPREVIDNIIRTAG